jgi:hypothetical protein
LHGVAVVHGSVVLVAPGATTRVVGTANAGDAKHNAEQVPTTAARAAI